MAGLKHMSHSEWCRHLRSLGWLDDNHGKCAWPTESDHCSAPTKSRFSRRSTSGK